MSMERFPDMLRSPRGSPFCRDMLMANETDPTNTNRAFHGYRRRCSKEDQYVLIHTIQ